MYEWIRPDATPEFSAGFNAAVQDAIRSARARGATTLGLVLTVQDLDRHLALVIDFPGRWLMAVDVRGDGRISQEVAALAAWLGQQQDWNSQAFHTWYFADFRGEAWPHRPHWLVEAPDRWKTLMATPGMRSQPAPFIWQDLDVDVMDPRLRIASVWSREPKANHAAMQRIYARLRNRQQTWRDAVRDRVARLSE